MSFNKVSLFICGMLCVLTLAACSSSEQSGPDDQGKEKNVQKDKVTLTMVQTFTREDEANRLQLLKHNIQTLEERYPYIHIKLKAVEQNVFRNEKLVSAMAAGSPPDIFDLFGGSDTERYAKAGRLLDLTKFLKTSGLKQTFVDGALKKFTVNGHIYGLPRAGYVEGFYYNKRIFQDLGLDIPQTWQDLLHVIKEIKDSKYIPIALGANEPWVPGMILNAIIIRHVGIHHFKNLVTGDYKWTSPQMTQAWQDFEQLVNMGAFPDDLLSINYTEQSHIFAREEAAMVYSGSWDALIFTSEQSDNLQDHLGFFMFPKIKGGLGDQTSINAGYSNGWGFSANVNKRQEKAIHKFIKLTWSQQAQKKQLLMAKVLPAVKIDDYSGMEPIIAKIIDVKKKATSTWPAYDSIIHKPVQNKFNNEILRVIADVDTPKEALANIQKVTNQQIEDRQKAVDGS